MKIERIAQNKLKITLFNEDLTKWNIDIKNLTSDSEEIRNIFWSILKQAQVETDFKIDGSQLMVEAISQPDKFVMIVTKTGAEKKKPIELPSAPKQRNLLIFAFPSINEVKQACSVIKNFYNGKSVLYRFEDEYYLSLNPYNSKKLDVLTEYGREIKDVVSVSGMLSEYGKMLITENAVEKTALFL